MLTSIVSIALVRPVEFDDDSVSAHRCLIFHSVMPLVPREIQSLVLRGSANPTCDTIDEPPAIMKRGTFRMYGLHGYKK